MDPNVPLVIPEIDASRIRDHKGAVGSELRRDHRAGAAGRSTNRIKRLILSTYQAASGAGAAAMDELGGNRPALISMAAAPKVMPHPYAFNLFTHNTTIDPRPGTTTRKPRSSRRRGRSLRTNGSPSASPASACRCCAPIARPSPSNAENPISESQVRDAGDGAGRADHRFSRAKNYFPMPIDAFGPG